jgi:hypothetical protein
MKMKMNQIYIVCCLVVLLISADSLPTSLPAGLQWDPSTLMQELPRELSSDPYIMEFLKIMYKWNTGASEFPSFEKLRGKFRDNLKQAEERRPHGYETREWVDKKLQQFDALAEKSAHPQLKIDRRAAQTLTLAYLINLPLIRERFALESLESELTLPTYVIFLDAQERASKAEHQYITSDDMIRTIFGWWTTVWPFCAPVPR